MKPSSTNNKYMEMVEEKKQNELSNYFNAKNMLKLTYRGIEDYTKFN